MANRTLNFVPSELTRLQKVADWATGFRRRVALRESFGSLLHSELADMVLRNG
jgi:hypothetical protein